MSTLNDDIKKFYDQSSPLWLNMWGEHMHHGYYGPDGREKKNNRQAQIDLIEELLAWGGIDEAENIMDIGCGVGGSARHLAQKYGAKVLGLTLSPVQAKRGKQYNQLAGLDDEVSIIVQDILAYEGKEGSFDFIYSMESAEHIPDKGKLMALIHRLLKPGGKFVMATWCHRDDTENPLSEKEQRHLEKVYKVYHIPPMISIENYRHLTSDVGFQSVRTDDWSKAVAPFWKAVILSALSWRGIAGLLNSGWGTIQGAWGMRHMQSGFRSGLIRFGLICGTK